MSRRLCVRLVKARKAKGLTQEQLADLSGVGRITIATLESGTNRNPTLRKLEMLATALGVDVAELVE